MFISLVIALGVTISGFIYYFKMSSNEDTLNTLLFRELNQVEGSLLQSLEKVQATLNYLLPENHSEDKAAAPQKAAIDLDKLQKNIEDAVKKLQNSPDLVDIEQTGKVSQGPLWNSTLKEFKRFSFSISEYNEAQFTGRFTTFDSTISVKLKSSIHHALKKTMARFQTVLLVDQQGTAWSLVNNSEQFSNESERIIRKVEHFLQRSVPAENQSGDQSEDNAESVLVTGTSFVDTRLSTGSVRIYVHPVLSTGLNEGSSAYYLLGIIDKKTINESKLQLPPKLLMWLILGLLMLIATVPLLKLRFVSSTYAIQKTDKSQIVIGTLFAAGILSIALVQQLFFNYYDTFKQEQLTHLHQNIRNDFKQEMETMFLSLDYMSFMGCHLYEDNASSKQMICGEQLTGFNVYSQAGIEYLSLFESIAAVNEHGKVDSGLVSYHSSKQLAFRKELDLSGRDYFKVGIAGEYWLHQWPYSSTEEIWGERQQEFYLQRLFNIEDGRRNTLISLPFRKMRRIIEDSQSTGLMSWVSQIQLVLQATQSIQNLTQESLPTTIIHWVKRMQTLLNTAYSIQRIQKAQQVDDWFKHMRSNLNVIPDNSKITITGTRFSSLVDRILPKNFSFAVINQNGDVLFHSDDSLSLNENFFTESNRNPELLIAAEHGLSANPTPITLNYKGVKHQALVGPLIPVENEDHAAKSLPWQLVVFFNPEELQNNNMILVFLAVFLFMLVMVPVFLWLRFVTHQRFWQQLVYFDKQRREQYPAFALLLFAASFCIQYQMGVIEPLGSRLLLWAALAFGVAVFFVRQFKLEFSQYFVSKQPLVGFGIMLAGFLVVCGISWSSQSWEHNTPLNWLFCLIGIGLLAEAYRTCVRGALPGYFKPCLQYASEKREARRYTTGYVWFLSGLIYFAAAVPASLIAYSTHDYLLEQQAHFEEQHAKQTLQARDESFNKYKAYLNGGPCLEEDVFPCNLRVERPLETVLESFFPGSVTNSENNSATFSGLQWVELPPSSDDNETEVEHEAHKGDVLIAGILSAIPSETAFVSHLTYSAKQVVDTHHPEMHGAQNLHYNADHLMLRAIVDGGWGIMLFISLFTPLTIYFWTRKLLVQRLMGEHIYDQYRVRSDCEAQDNMQSGFQVFKACPDDAKHSHLMLNATRMQAQAYLQERDDEKGLRVHPNIHFYGNAVHRLTPSLEKVAEQFLFLTELSQQIKTTLPDGEYYLVAISGIEQVSLNAELRKDALDLLYELHVNPAVILVIVAETAPLYRILNPGCYSEQQDITPPDTDEKSAWTKLFSEFNKHYVWCPLKKSMLDNPFDIANLIAYECNAWQEIQHLEADFLRYTEETRCANDGVSPCSASEPHRPYELNDYWQPEQVIEYMLVYATPLYRRKWEECTRQEKLILWKVANGASINPSNAMVIEHLVRRGFLYRHKGWHLVNESFRRFILVAEDEATINDWLDNAGTGTWNVLRIPIFALLLVLLVIFVYSSGSSMNSLLSVATATLGLIPLLLKNISLLKGSGAGEIE
jgi:hypothetical protein|tara:strand:+ start:6067 stop:10617 length:4551 start_codon:yes stop_codon:yes gene_type:complete